MKKESTFAIWEGFSKIIRILQTGEGPEDPSNIDSQGSKPKVFPNAGITAECLF